MTDNIIELKVPPRLPNLLPAEYGNFRYFVADLVSRFTFFAYGSDNGGLSTHTQLVVASLSHTQVADRLSSMVIHQAGLLIKQAAQIRELQSRLNNPSAVNGTKPGLVGLNGFGLQILED